MPVSSNWCRFHGLHQLESTKSARTNVIFGKSKWLKCSVPRAQQSSFGWFVCSGRVVHSSVEKCALLVLYLYISRRPYRIFMAGAVYQREDHQVLRNSPAALLTRHYSFAIHLCYNILSSPSDNWVLRLWHGRLICFLAVRWQLLCNKKASNFFWFNDSMPIDWVFVIQPVRFVKFDSSLERKWLHLTAPAGAMWSMVTVPQCN